MTAARKAGRPGQAGYRVYLCGLEPVSAAAGPLQPNMAPTCPSAEHHAPMPADYGAWEAVANRRQNAGQRNRRCSGCGLWALWLGGREVPGWPRTMLEVKP